MMVNRKRIGRRGLLATVPAITALAVLASAGCQPAAAPASDSKQSTVVSALEKDAKVLRSTEPGGTTTDLRALGTIIGNAKVVGLGEATHGSHEFFAMKERVFRYLVEEKGFSTFALEMSWSAGLTIDEFLQGGEGDARQIAAKTLAASPWEREEFAHLIGWMRDYNTSHPQQKVHFMGDDISAPKAGDLLFARVTDYMRKARPEALQQLNALYAGVRPLDDLYAYMNKPLAERRKNADKAQEALDLVTATKGTGDDYEWAVQHARNIAQTLAYAAVDVKDPASINTVEHMRDKAMADTVAWWQRRTGDKVLLSAHNGHVGYRSTDPKMTPTPQGTHLRRDLGRDYVSIGFTFARGSFLTKDASFDGDWKKVTVPPATKDMNEYTLDQVHHRDYFLDLRALPSEARAWLNTARPTYDAGTVYKKGTTLAIGKAYDVLIHLHQVREADKL
ncbi:erythromycin esterase family protein [Streptomyces sp. NPDC018947]|uniref:erythromycin esterase family protein n=1 Tax=Streptomyces sp. NPDC018947 TaxID=3365054 RepID=UPI003796CA15